MKKIFFFCLAAVLALPAMADAPEIRIVPRLEGYVQATQGETPEWSFGASALYAFVDGDISSNFSYSASLHLLSPSPKDLYAQKYPLVMGSWLDWAYVSYDGGFFGADLGKIVHNVGSFEFEDDDVDCYYPMTSMLWNTVIPYQWGATVRLCPWETQSFELQFTTSPFMTSLSDKTFAYSFCWRGEFGVFSTNWAYSRQHALEESEEQEGLMENNAYNYLGIDNRLTFDNFMYTIGFSNCGTYKIDDLSCSEFSARAKFIGSEKIAVEAKASLKYLKDPCYGMTVEYFPLGDERLRFFAAASNQHVHIEDDAPFNVFLACLGVRYDLTLAFRKH